MTIYSQAMYPIGIDLVPSHFLYRNFLVVGYAFLTYAITTTITFTYFILVLYSQSRFQISKSQFSSYATFDYSHLGSSHHLWSLNPIIIYAIPVSYIHILDSATFTSRMTSSMSMPDNHHFPDLVSYPRIHNLTMLFQIPNHQFLQFLYGTHMLSTSNWVASSNYL